MRHARSDLTPSALASLAAASVALAARVADPFAHGTWLVAYLVLVGFLAQLLLGLGQGALLSAGGLSVPPRRVRLAQTLLWNFGGCGAGRRPRRDEVRGRRRERQPYRGTGVAGEHDAAPAGRGARPPERARLGLRRSLGDDDGQHPDRNGPGVGHPLDVTW
jgi:hypothetical protein